MTKQNRIIVEYTLKTDSGFLVEKTQKFLTIKSAIEFIRINKHIMVGRPTVIS